MSKSKKQTVEEKKPGVRGRRPGSKGHCSYCGDVGHYKKTCPKLKQDLAEGKVQESDLVKVELRVGVDPDDK
jgi:hypothetical protein